MSEKEKYYKQITYCGKPQCKRCQNGRGHGPYWYAYQTIEGHTKRRYVGKHLPSDITPQQTREEPPGEQSRKSLYRIMTLGRWELQIQVAEDTWQKVSSPMLDHSNVRRLLQYLISSHSSSTREQVVDCLWPDAEHGSDRLDKTVYNVRQILEDAAISNRNDLISLSNDVVVDANVFDELITHSHHASDVQQKEQMLRDALVLYKGNFLSSSTDGWVLERRDSLRRRWISGALELSDILIAREAVVEAYEVLFDIVRRDPSNEAAAQRLIRLLFQLGRRTEAIRIYKRLSTYLKQHYQIIPMDETRTIYDALRAGTHPAPQPDPPLNTLESAARLIGRAHQLRLVGRVQEYEQLTSLISEVEQAAQFRLDAQKRSGLATFSSHRPQCILLMGDVGIGKTRLAEEVSREAKRHGWSVAWSRVYAHEGMIPYRLWIEVIRKAMNQGIWRQQEINKRPLVFQPLGTLLPELYEIGTAVALPSSFSPEQERLRLWEAVKELLIVVSEKTPLLIVLDDLQWSDYDSCDLLAYVARRLRGYPIVIVGTCRDNELIEDHAFRRVIANLRREDAAELLPLPPLTHEDTVELVSQVSPLSASLTEQITARAAGNPYFAEELARMTYIAQNDTQERLPETIGAVLSLRLDRLSLNCQNFLKTAAILGSSFEFQVIKAMERESTTNYHEDTVLELIEQALRSGMLTEERVGTHVTYSFWHPLLASHLYESMSAARRASLHRRAALALQRLSQDEKEAALITYHLEKGGAEPQQIADYAERAGTYAYNLASYQQAEEHYRLALQTVPQGIETVQQRLFLLETLAECARIRADSQAAEHFLRTALHLHAAHARGSQEDTIHQIALLRELAKLSFDQADLNGMRRLISQNEYALREEGVEQHRPLLAGFALDRGFVLWKQGEYHEAIYHAKRSYNLLKFYLFVSPASSPPLFSDPRLNRLRRSVNGDPVDLARALVLIAKVRASQGRGAEGILPLLEATTIFEEYQRTRDIAIVQCDLADIYIRSEKYDQAESALLRCQELAGRIGEIALQAFALANFGLIRFRSNRMEEAVDCFQQAIDMVTKSGDNFYASWWLASLAYMYVKQSKLEDANTSLLRAISLGKKIGETPAWSYTVLVLGMLRLAQAQTATGGHRTTLLHKARRVLQRVLSMAAEEESKIECRLILAEVYLHLGQVAMAHVELSIVEHTMSKDMAWLRQHYERIARQVSLALNHKSA